MAGLRGDSDRILPDLLGAPSSSPDGRVKEPLITGLARSKDLPRDQRDPNAERNLVAVVLKGEVELFEGAPGDPPADPRKAAVARFGEEVDKLASSADPKKKLTAEQAAALKAIGEKFFPDDQGRLDWPGLAQAFRNVPEKDRSKVHRAFENIVQSNGNDAGETGQVKVSVIRDGFGYKVVFQGDAVNGGKGQMEFRTSDNSITLLDESGKTLPQEGVTAFTGSLRDKFAKNLEAKEVPPPPEPGDVAAKPVDANATACREAFEKMIKDRYKDNKDAQAAALALFDHFKEGNAVAFKGIQDKFKDESDPARAERARENALARLFNVWVDAAKKVKPVDPDFFKNNPDIKKTNPKEAEAMENTLKLLSVRDKWLDVSEGNALPLLPDIPKPAPPEPKVDGIAIAGLTPNKPASRDMGGYDVGAVDRFQALRKKSAAGTLEEKANEPAELKAYELGWTSNEPHYQYARAAYMKGAELKLDAKSMTSLEKLLKDYVAFHDNGKRGKQPNIEEIKKLLKLP